MRVLQHRISAFNSFWAAGATQFISSRRICAAAVIIVVGVNSDGRRKIPGMDIGPSEAETFRTAFLRKLARRGLRNVKLVVSDAHKGIKAADRRTKKSAIVLRCIRRDEIP